MLLFASKEKPSITSISKIAFSHPFPMLLTSNVQVFMKAKLRFDRSNSLPYFPFICRARPHGLRQQQQPVPSRGRQPHHLSLQRPGEVKSLPAARSRSTRSREVDLAHERWVVSARRASFLQGKHHALLQARKTLQSMVRTHPNMSFDVSQTKQN